MSLVQDNVLPVISLEVRAIDDTDFEACKNDWEGDALLRCQGHLRLADAFSFLFRAMVDYYRAVWKPLAEFVEPISDCGQRTGYRNENW